MHSTHTKMVTARILNGSLLVVVILVIGVSFLNNILGIVSDFPSTEKRVLAVCGDIKRPKNQKIIDYIRSFPSSFPSQFENCFNDNFAFRNAIVAGTNYARLMLFDKATANIVSKGKNDWYYNTDASVVSAYNGSNKYTDAQVDKWINVFKQRNDKLNSMNIQYILTIVPNKMTMYPEHLPEKYKNTTNPTRLDQLNSVLSVDKSLDYINVKPDLISLKSTTDVFYRTDSHWSQEAVFQTYSKITTTLDSNIRFTLKNKTDYTVARQKRFSDMSALMGLTKFFYEYPNQFTPNFSEVGVRISPDFNQKKSGNKIYEEYEHRNASLIDMDSVVVFGDSYTDELRPFLANSFSEVNFLKTAEDFDFGYIDEHKPKVVIQIFNESNLVN